MNTQTAITAQTFSFAVKKIATTRTIDFDALPEVSQDFLVDYGIKQYMADCHAAIKRENYRSQDEFVAAVNAALDARELALREGRVGKSDKSVAVAKIVASMTDEQLAALGLVRA